MSIILKTTNLEKKFGNKIVFSKLNFELEKNKVTVITGKNGIGKSTFLRSLVLLENLQNGSIEIENKKVLENGEVLDEKIIRDKIGIVFQDLYLWNNKTILENITEALIFVKKMSKQNANKKAKESLNKFKLNHNLLDKYPSDLSGGQKQRVAIIRTLVTNPKILLLDEPTSSLDNKFVKDLIGLIKNICDKENKTILIITHDLNFAEKVGDSIINFDSLF